MENIQETTHNESDAKFGFAKLFSKKYNVKYEIFWSENFIWELQKFTNILFTNMLKKINSKDTDEDSRETTTDSWLIIKELNNKMERREIKERCSHSSNHLMTMIEDDEIMEDLEAQLKLEEDIGENSKMTPSSDSDLIWESAKL